MLFRTILIKSQLIEFYGLDLFLACVYLHLCKCKQKVRQSNTHINPCISNVKSWNLIDHGYFYLENEQGIYCNSTLHIRVFYINA